MEIILDELKNYFCYVYIYFYIKMKEDGNKLLMKLLFIETYKVNFFFKFLMYENISFGETIYVYILFVKLYKGFIV